MGYQHFTFFFLLAMLFCGGKKENFIWDRVSYKNYSQDFLMPNASKGLTS